MKKLPFIFILLLVLASCTKEEEDAGHLNSEVASDAIHETAGDVSDDIITFMESDGVGSVSTILDFLFESSEFSDIGFRKDEQKARILEIGRLFGSLPAARVSNNNFPTGVYEWNELEGDFIFVEDAEELILKFPVGASETNNGIFTLSEFAFDINELPTDFAANITVDEVLMVDADFRVNWSDDQFPESADIYVFVNPFTFDLNFNDTADKSSTLDASIAIGDEVIAAIDLVAHYATSLKGFPKDIEGSVEYRSVKIAGGVDLLAADQSESGDPNDFIDLALYVDDNQVGDIIFVLETDGIEEYYEPYVQYLDGTEESLEDILNAILEEVEIALMDI
ncbi:MAG: hypothetical protein GY816_19280 [Cytophagales bacterium]|nr:hypothetical protein [Cytophagales bacterium]